MKQCPECNCYLQNNKRICACGYDLGPTKMLRKDNLDDIYQYIQKHEPLPQYRLKKWLGKSSIVHLLTKMEGHGYLLAQDEFGRLETFGRSE